MTEEQKKSGINVTTPPYEVKGTVQIVDKDGKVKGEFEVTSLELNEEVKNAIERNT